MLLPSDDGNAPFTRFANFAKQEPPGQPTQLPYRTIQLVSSMLRESHKVFLFLPTTLLPTPHSLLRLGLQMRALALNRRADLATLRWIGNRLSDRIQAFYYPLEGTTSVECACAFISESSTETASLNKNCHKWFSLLPNFFRCCWAKIRRISTQLLLFWRFVCLHFYLRSGQRESAAKFPFLCLANILVKHGPLEPRHRLRTEAISDHRQKSAAEMTNIDRVKRAGVWPWVGRLQNCLLAFMWWPPTTDSVICRKIINPFRWSLNGL